MAVVDRRVDRGDARLGDVGEERHFSQRAAALDLLSGRESGLGLALGSVLPLRLRAPQALLVRVERIDEAGDVGVIAGVLELCVLVRWVGITRQPVLDARVAWMRRPSAEAAPGALAPATRDARAFRLRRR